MKTELNDWKIWICWYVVGLMFCYPDGMTLRDSIEAFIVTVEALLVLSPAIFFVMGARMLNDPNVKEEWWY